MAALPIIEPMVILDTFTTGHGTVEQLGDGILRVSLCALQTVEFNGDRTRERVIVAKLVGPKTGLVEMARAILQAAGEPADVDDLPAPTIAARRGALQ